MRIKDRECGFVFSYQAFSVGEAHDVPASLISLPITSHLLRSCSLRLHYMARTQNSHNFTFKNTCQLAAVTKAFPRCKSLKDVFTSLTFFRSGGSGSGSLFHLDLLVLLTGSVAVLREDEGGEVLSPNLAAAPSP